MRRRPLLALITALMCVTTFGRHGRAAEPMIEVDGAFVRAGDGAWTIGNPQIEFEIGGNGSSAGLRGIRDPQSGRDWNRSGSPDGVVTVNGQRLLIGGPGTQFQGAETSEYWGGVKLDLRYRLTTAGIEVVRSYVCYAGSPVIETWTTFRGGSRSVVLSDLTAYSVAIPSGTFNWITGIMTPGDQGGPFTRMNGDFDDGQVFEIGSDNRASEQNVPWYSVKLEDGAQFFGALLWSGAWRLRANRQGDNIAMQIGMRGFETSLGVSASLEMPHAVLGFTTSLLPDT